MQKIFKILIVLIFSQNVFALDPAVENIQALCGLAKEGKQSEIKGKIQLQADGSVKLATVGGKGELSFSKSEWDGLQQILWAKQPDSAKTYTECVKNALPYFKSKVATPPPSPKSTSKPAKKVSSVPPKDKSTPPVTPPATKADGDTNTLSIGTQSAEKIINATEINGNIEMGK
jgi:hypothetical protein